MKTIIALVSFLIVMVLAACGTSPWEVAGEQERPVNQNLEGIFLRAIDARLEGQIDEVTADGAAEQNFLDGDERMSNRVTYRHDDGRWAMIAISLRDRGLSDIEFGETVISVVGEEGLRVLGCTGLTSSSAYNYDEVASTARLTLHAPAADAPEDVLATVSVFASWQSTGQEVESRFTIVEF